MSSFSAVLLGFKGSGKRLEISFFGVLFGFARGSGQRLVVDVCGVRVGEDGRRDVRGSHCVAS